MEIETKKMGIGDKNYPKILSDLKDPPKVLYCRGSLQDIDFKKCLAIVGSRRMTHYGEQVLERFIPQIVQSGVIVISGFMYGVDTKAHELTIENGGKTVAVLGNGLDIIYPVENEKLYRKILDTGGAILSEYSNKTKPYLWTYPRRNRIVASLAQLGTLIIEAGENSGSLVTAKWAKKLKRPLYAIPGPITSSASTGCNQLLRSKLAKIALNASDIVGIESKKEPRNQQSTLTDLQAKIYQTLLLEPLTLDELCIAIDKPITAVSSEISLLSLQGIVQDINGKLFAKN
jgi:DNA processing protein